MRASANASLGLAAWAAALAWIQPPLAHALLLLGPLVAVPLVLGLAHPGGPRSPLQGRWRVALAVQLPAALAVAVSFALPVGRDAALWTLPWLLFAAFLAFLAALRFMEHGGRPLHEVAVDAGLGFLLVGAFWLTFSRWGQPFLGFGEPIAFLTAAHFHFAGLVLPVLGGLAAGAQRHPFARRAGAAVSLALVVGIPLVAAGITVEEQHGNPLLNVAAVTWITAAAVGAILLQAALALRPGPLLPRVLWGLSAAALPVGMALASLFVYGNAFGGPHLTLDQMVRTHAVVNVFGFALPGLVAWTLAGVPARNDLQILVPLLGDRVRHGGWASRPLHAGERRAGDNEDTVESSLGRERPGPPEPDGPFRRAAAAVMRFAVFPPRILEPSLQRVPLQVGDTVCAEYRAFPLVRVGFGARVVEVFDGPEGDGWLTGFAYQTLAGHPECGVERFMVRKDAEGHVRLVLQGWSRPGHPLSAALRGMARRRQVAAAQAAMAEFPGRLGTREPRPA